MGTVTPLPFVRPKENEDPSNVSGWDGWVVEPTGDAAADYQQGAQYADMAIKLSRAMQNPGVITFTVATIYAKAHSGAAVGAMEKGFIDRIVKLACLATLD